MTAQDTIASRAAVLAGLLRAELGFGILGLKLFMACVVIASAMLGMIWLLSSGLDRAMGDNARRILGGDVAVTVVNAPLDEATVSTLDGVGRSSRVVELRSTAAAGPAEAPRRLTVELKAVDGAYPLYGSVELAGGQVLQEALGARDGLPGAVVEPGLLTQLGLDIGDRVRLGGTDFEIRAALLREPDRLSAGTFLVGPRVLVALDRLQATGLTERGSLVEYRTRIRFPTDTPSSDAMAAVAAAEPARGWEIQSPSEAAERVREVTNRTTTFLGISGLAAFAVGLTGAWAAVAMWIGRRHRTIAQYRLSGATASMVVALHASLVAIAAAIALAIGLGLAAAVAISLLEMLTARLHLLWAPADLGADILLVAVTLSLGLAGALVAGLSGVARLAPLRALRGDGAGAGLVRRDGLIACGLVLAALALAIAGLPNPAMAVVAALGLAAVAGLLALFGSLIARGVRRVPSVRFLSLAVKQGFDSQRAVMLRAVALGIGIAGITGVVAVQHSLQAAFETQIPQKAPDLVLLDVQAAQVERIRDRVASTPALGELQATPFMRTRLLEVNGRPVEEALVDPDKDWVIEGDRSFSWTAEPTGAELLAGTWWPADYDGPSLVSAEEDVMQAFDLKPGDTLTYSVLGRVFTSEVANIRKEYHRTMRPEFLVVASPDPFRDAPHGWIVSLQGRDEAALNGFISELSRSAANVTVIDVRRIVREATDVVEGAILGTLLIAAILLLAGSLSLAATVSADVDARRREAVALSIVGATRREIALARFCETAATGLIAAFVGGSAGLLSSWWIADGALRVDWVPGPAAVALPLALGVLTSLAAGLAGGLGALPRGRGQLARLLSG
ncbi:ABC transporter permease [Thalassobaculum litoreum]|uniref:Putative ABC transport system permease protein n=1 Tax=Thalassobaculum litoreum DSM 18839 TaxID=1123362 RepID=A0A8G2EXW7_9PROT|nr:FtsX-like permease family protein [Thalassobaculum litoreum]SDG35871.1 putative ABC transport system permease protein [Thalassobaculum litoreum DSM 18839]